eukprot:scaffold33548_cov101-Isochrysis_galbana.AAC.2
MPRLAAHAFQAQSTGSHSNRLADGNSSASSAAGLSPVGDCAGDCVHAWPLVTCSSRDPTVKSLRSASCCGDPRTSRRGTRSPSSYT